MNTEGIEFDNLRLIIGVVEDNNDPENLQRLKASIPGMFSTDTMDVKALPWIYPWHSYGYQSYSSILPGCKILVIYDITNYYSLWYFPYFSLNDNTKNYIKGETDILMCRSLGHGDCTIYQNEEDGIMVRIGDSKVNITSSGDIICASAGKSFKITGGICKCGTDEGEYEPMVLGNKIVNVLGKLAADLDQIGACANGSPYTTHLTPKITGGGSAADNLKRGIKDILSDSAKVAK